LTFGQVDEKKIKVRTAYRYLKCVSFPLECLIRKLGTKKVLSDTVYRCCQVVQVISTCKLHLVTHG